MTFTTTILVTSFASPMMNIEMENTYLQKV